MEITSNPSLCNVWEMLVNRLGAVEEMTSSIVDFLDLKHRHESAIGPLGKTFSGLAFCKRPIGLMMNGRFGVDGRFLSSGPDDAIIIAAAQIPVFYDVELWSMESIGDTLWKGEWDSDLSEIWGSEKYCSVRAAHDLASMRSDAREILPSAQDYGLDSPHPSARVAVFEALLKKRHPGLIAIGASGLAVANTDIGSVVALLDAIMRDLGVAVVPWINMTPITAEVKPLALAVLGRYDLTDAWKMLSKEARARIYEHRHCPLSYFTDVEVGEQQFSDSEDDL